MGVLGLMGRVFSGFMFVLLLASMLTLPLSVQSVKTELSPAENVTQDMVAVQKATALVSQEAPPAEWTNHYGGYADEYAFSVDEASDGGYVMAGGTHSYGIGVDAWLVKTYSNGTRQWEQYYGGTGYDYASFVQQTNDSGYILAGATDSFSSDGSRDGWLIKTDAAGNMVWTKTLGLSGSEAHSIQQTSDGGYIIAGVYPVSGNTFWLVKTDAAGNMEWNRPWGGNGSDIAYSAQQTRDGGYIAVGSTTSFGSIDGVIIKTYSDGTIEWNQTYGQTNSLEMIYSIQQTYDGGYVALGISNSSTLDDDFWLIKISPGGSLMWSRFFGGLDDDWGSSVQQTSDGGYVLAGSTYSSGDSSPDYLVVKTDSNGNEEWRQIYGTDDTDQAQAIHETKDGGFVVAGYTYYYGGGISTDGWLVKITGDTDGDGLHDSWERNGIDYNKDGVIDLILPDADWKHKDVFVEVDYMGVLKPDLDAIDDVKYAFRNAPVKNPDNKDGINLHVDIDDVIEFNETTALAEFYNIKGDHFGNDAERGDPNSVNILAAKKLVYRYALFLNKLAGAETRTGLAEIQGNDFLISLGSLVEAGEGTRGGQAGTFMHELGHTFGLRDGGGDDINFKPNYLSVMNYAFQTPEVYEERPLDYSRARLPRAGALDEGNLSEPDGIGGGPYDFTIYSSPNGYPILSSAGLPIDWNGNGSIDTDENVEANINNFSRANIMYNSPRFEVLHGYDDWQNLKYDFRNSTNFASGVDVGDWTTNELTRETIETIREIVKSMHDVAVLNVDPSQPVIVRGFDLPLNVTLMNQGGNNETFHVNVYANATAIASQELTLERGNITTIALMGETASLSDGDYTLSAYATPVASETDLADNTYGYGVIKITSTSAGWVEWSRSYPKTRRAQAYSVCHAKDGGFAIAGGTGTPGSNAFLLVKTYPDGTEQWSRTYSCGQYCDQYAYSVVQTSDGGYMLAGYLHAGYAPYWLWLVKTDSEGNTLWNKTYASDIGNSELRWVARQTSDGGYIAAGTQWWNENATERHEMWLTKTDSEGNELWNKTYGGIDQSIDWAEAYSVWQTTDGGYALGGYTYSSESVYGAAYLVKTDSLGNEQWNKTYPAARIFSLQQTRDEGYILGGAMYYSGQNDYSDFWLLKTDSGGNTQWNKTYDRTRWTEGSEEAYSVQQTSDGGYILAGYTDRVVDQLLIRYVWVVKADADGNMQADLAYGSENTRESVAYSVQQIADSSYIAAGYITQPRDDDPYATDFLLLKFNLLMIIPEFTPNLVLPILLVSTLAIAVFSRKRRTTIACAATMH